MSQIRQQYFLAGAVLVDVVAVAAVVMETVAEGVEEACFHCLHCVVLDIIAVVVMPGEVMLVPMLLVVVMVGRAVEIAGVGVDMYMSLTLAWLTVFSASSKIICDCLLWRWWRRRRSNCAAGR